MVVAGLPQGGAAVTTLADIEKAVLGLPPAECARLADWLSSLMLTPRRVAEPAVAYTGAMSFPLTLEEYLELEEHSRIRHEYIAGEIFAMTGVTKRHNRIAGRIYHVFAGHLRGGPCDVYISDVKVKLQVNRDTHVYYPDVMVVCDREPQEDRYVADPKLVVEVLSPSTAGVDRHEKRIAYRGIPALEEYVIVAQDAVEVTVYRREDDWAATVLDAPEASLELRSIRLALCLAQIYEGEMLCGG
jgi:Uma2 family endonuclease